MAKRQFTPAQRAAQARFAAAARAGTLRKGAKLKGSRRSARKSTPMAKTSGRARRALSRARSYASRGRSAGGRFKQPIDGALGAVAARAGAYVSPTYGPAAGMVAVGMYRRNEALTTLGAMSLAGAAIDSAKFTGVPMAPSGGYL